MVKKQDLITDEALQELKDISDKGIEIVKREIEKLISELTLQRCEDSYYDENGDFKGYDSPIEELMMIALNGEFYKYNEEFFDIEYQFKIKTLNGNYRVDFLVCHFDREKNKETNIVIECDGHDFHEKTKEQAKKDKSRDRDLLYNGYHVMRFTGSEIYEDANKCAREVYRTLNRMIGGW